jgi:hypothetical protein
MPPLTKSRYRLGLDCPTKIFYANNREIYPNTKSDNEFLKALAEGGFQVAELSKRMFPGEMIETLDYAESLAKTARLLEAAKTTVHEAAFSHEDFFIRADILVKSGNRVDLIEVKSKSYDEEDETKAMMTGKNEIRASWFPYLHDIAFQTFVIRQAHPEWQVTPHLLLVNKAAVAPIDGINSLFVCQRDDRGNPVVSTPHGVPEVVTACGLLKKHDVSHQVDWILSADYDGESFAQRAERWAKASVGGSKISTPIGASKCAKCEFQADREERATGKLSGFHECWKAATGLDDNQLDSPLVLEIWNYRKKQALLSENIFLLRDVDPDTRIADGNSPAPISGWSNADRQRIQVRCAREGNTSSPVVDVEGLRAALSQLNYPIHFIDFETTRCALPFHKGEPPYGNVAFQFSHHVANADGTILHADEWICLDRGIQPNEQFAKALQEAVGRDGGSILHYAAHERTVLADIASSLELQSDSAPSLELAAWIRSIVPTQSNPGRMVDMKEILVRHYYHPLTRGSNSLKAVLPAILQTSPFLKKTYSAPVYGTPAMPSCNFQNTEWISAESADPYGKLPKLETIEPSKRLFDDETIRDGGAAMTAYAKCQFTEISPEETANLRSALLKYCELDTLAMVMLWQTWKNDHTA